MAGEWQGPLCQPHDRTAIAALRRATRTEIPLGESGFVEGLEAKFQIRLRPQPLGRPNKKPAQSEAPPTHAAPLKKRMASS